MKALVTGASDVLRTHVVRKVTGRREVAGWTVMPGGTIRMLRFFAGA